MQCIYNKGYNEPFHPDIGTTTLRRKKYSISMNKIDKYKKLTNSNILNLVN